jgi:putative sporulation protein YtxC
VLLLAQVVSVCVSEGLAELRERFESDLHFLRQEGFDVQVGERQVGDRRFLTVDVTPGTVETLARARETVTDAISDCIVNHAVRALIDRFLKTGYQYFDLEEQDSIRQHAARILHGNTEEGRTGYEVSRHGQIRRRVRDYLERSEELVLDGFITFRLKDWVGEIEEAVDRGVDDFLLDREYKEFVHVLRSFVDAQEPRVDEVHVFLAATGTFELRDTHRNVITNEYLKDFVLELVDSEVNQEDLLISALITVAPRKLLIHCPPAVRSGHTLETLRQVFAGRITVCEQCPLCRDAGGLGKLARKHE